MGYDNLRRLVFANGGRGVRLTRMSALLSFLEVNNLMYVLASFASIIIRVPGISA